MTVLNYTATMLQRDYIQRLIREFMAALQRLLEKKGDIRTILPCHHDCPIDPGYIEKNLEDAISLREGRLKGKKHPVLPCVSFKGKWTEFYCDM